MADINITEVALVSRKHQPLNQNVLFVAGDGEAIRSGDTVNFRLEGDVFATLGTVEDLQGLRVACFSMILAKWKYYNLVTYLQPN